jgi:hypothetical protein
VERDRSGGDRGAVDCTSPDAPSSRLSGEAAGWYGGPPPSTERWQRRLRARDAPKWDTFSWLTVRALLESANDALAKRSPTIIRGRRARYVAAQRAAGAERADHGPALPGRGSFGHDFVVDWTAVERPRFLLLGDPGEADASQYAVIDPLLEVHRGGARWERTPRRGSDFMVVLSDVIYPAGDINEYVNGFYLPFREYDAPIYAIPGNHDWYDGLSGFMFHFCDAEPLATVRFSRLSYRPGELVTRAVWRAASRPDREALAPWVEERRRLSLSREGVPAPRHVPPRPVQPAPYFAIQLDGLLLVAIDSGVAGELDAEQGAWLRRMSARPGPKVLLTGKPIWVNNEYHPGEIAWGEAQTVDDIVRAPQHGYVAAIGGDVHNYQRYPVRVGARTIQYVVSGGGGAYLSATHMIPSVGPTAEHGLPAEDRIAFDESGFRCYPLRGDSLALFCRRVGPALIKALWAALATAAVAGVVFGLLVDIDGRRRLAALPAAVAVLALAAVVWGGSRLASEVSRRVGDGYRIFVVGTTAAVAAGGVVAGLLAFDDADVTVAVVAALAVPLAGLVGVLLAYVGRGSLPRIAPDLLLVLPVLALPPAIAAPYGLGAVGDALLYGLATAVGALVLVPLVGLLRSRTNRARASVYRVLVTVAWAALAAAVLVRFGDRWLTLCLLAWLGLALFLGYLLPRLGPGGRRVHQQRPDAVGPEAGTAAGLALAAVALVGLEWLAGSDAPAIALAAVAAAAAVTAALFALVLLVGLRLVSPGRVLRLRTGEIPPGAAASYVARRISAGTTPVRAHAGGPADAAWDGAADVVRRLGKRVSELADTNEAPFYKSFLSLELDDSSLEIRCWGVTGYDDEQRSPSLEDCVRIPLVADDR